MTSKHKMEEEKLDANSISFIALCHRYCVTLESLADEATDSDDFCRSMLYMLPRLYMTAFDLGMSGDDISDYRDADSGDSVNEVLDENAYTIVRDSIAAIMGSHDTFLETNVEDMRYSDTPIASSVSECLADIYQSAYDFVATAKELPAEMLPELLSDMKIRFRDYWSETLCNVLRILNSLYQRSELLSDNF